MAKVIDVPNYGQVEFPDDMSDDDIVKAIKKNGMGYKQPQGTISRTEKVLKGTSDPFLATSQLVNKVPFVDDVQNFAAKSITKLLYPNLANDIESTQPSSIDSIINSKEREYQAKRQSAGESGFDGYRLTGNIISPANLAIASKLPVAGSLGARILQGGLGGAGLSAATQPVIESDNFLASKAKQAAIGAVGGAVLPMVTSSIGRLISPKASTNPNVQLLRQEGVNPTIGQTLGGFASKAEEKAQSIPILGDMISGARNKANSQFETAAYNRALTPIGEKLPAGLSGRDALVHTENTLKTAYDDVLTRIGAIKPDQQFTANVNNLVSMVKGQMMPNAEKAKFGSALNDLKQSIDKNGVITSDAYKALESSLGSDARKLGISTNIYESKLSPAVKQLQAELREMLSRQAGTKADELGKVNTAWANFKRVQDAASKLGADDGKFSPAQFQNAVKTVGKNKGQFARGNALGQDLGDAGKSVLTGKVPNSGTADRLMLGGGTLLGGAQFAPEALLGLGAASSMYTQPAQRMLNYLVSSRPDFAPLLADKAVDSTRYMLPLTGLLGGINQQ